MLSMRLRVPNNNDLYFCLGSKNKGTSVALDGYIYLNGPVGLLITRLADH